MFAYCLNNPVNGVDPSGTYYNPIIVNDGGSLYSSEDLAILQIIRESFPDVGCTSAPLHCKMSEGTYYSTGFGNTFLSLLNLGSNVQNSASNTLEAIGFILVKAELPPSAVLSRGADYLFLAKLMIVAARYVTKTSLYFSNVPALPKGSYNVVCFDLTTSRQSYTNGATGEREANEYHQVIRVFIDQNGKYSSHTSYYVDTVYRG